MRPNVHVQDLSRFYSVLLDAPPRVINGEAFNVCRENASVMSLAEMIRDELDRSLPIDTVPSDDPRSYHLCASKSRDLLDFEAEHDLVMAVRQLKDAYESGQIRDSRSTIYRNVAWMKAHPDVWRNLTKRAS